MGSNVMVELSKEEPTAFNFAVEDIRAMKLLADGGMLISFTDGSSLTITNFQEAKASFPFTDISMNDGTVMNLQKVATGLASTLPNDTVADLTIMKPQGGIGATDLAFVLQEGKTYTLGFELADVASVEQKGGDLLVTFKDGSHLTLQNYEVVGAGVLPPQMTLADGSVIPAAQLINVLNVAAAEQVKLVEPAAGETGEQAAVVIQKQPQVAAKEIPVEQLAELEPAAGGAAGPIGGTGGYGFNSSVDGAGIVGLAAIGPIGPTELQFNAPEPEDFSAAPNPAAPGPAAPTLIASDRFTFEDEPVNLLISANGGANAANETLTLTVSGIPAGWTVDIPNSGGTFNPGTGTWTITLPQGQSFSNGPILIPPHDSDVDIRQPSNPPLTITLTTTDVNTLVQETTSTQMNVTVDAVADQPDLAVNNVVLQDGVPTNLQIAAAVTDTDGSEILTTATLTGIPAGFVLTGGGATLNAGVWTVDANQISNLQLTSPPGFSGSFVVTVRVNNQDWTQAGKDAEITTANNTNFNIESFQVTVQDAVPVIGDSVATVDDTSLSGGNNVATGNIAINFFNDTPGTFGPAPANTFTSTGFKTGGVLSSNGFPVNVALNGNTYTGTANGVTVFTLQVNANGSYTFTQFEQLDHSDTNNTNEAIQLNFTVTGTDSDGDTDTGTITITVLDDAPVANDDQIATGNTVNGNVTSNDAFSQDVPNVLTQIVWNGQTFIIPQNGNNIQIVGQYGTLTINNTGAYTYATNNNGQGTDNFTYTLRDGDGDTDTAVLAATINDVDSIPVIGNSAVTVDDTNLSGGANIINGQVPVDYLVDGPGSLAPAPANTFTAGGSLLNGALSSTGNPVTVSLAGNTYTGTANGLTIFTLVVNANGSYTFTQFEQLDHANANNPNDALTLNFTVIGTDNDGDTDTGVITVTVLDDGPVAVADNFTGNATVTGDITTNDQYSQDTIPTGDANHVYDVFFGGQTVLVPQNGTSTTVTNAAGTLTIDMNGVFTYTPPTPGAGTVFRYRLIDFDGDLSAADAANGTTVTVDTDDVPVIGDSTVTVDETNLSGGAQVASGNVTFNYGGDGQGAGAVVNTGYTGPALTSQGTAVVISLVGNTYTGTANGQTIFTMVVNPLTGAYTFTQFQQLDHPNPNNPNEPLNLTFGLSITDADGDVDLGTITAIVLDDAPIAVADTFSSNTQTVTGNIVTNDNFSEDTFTVGAENHVYDVFFGGQTVLVPQNGTSTTVTNAAGTLTIDMNGVFTYTPPVPGGGTVFRYRLIDFDGDLSAADAANGTTVTVDTDDVPVIGDSTVTVDETNLSGGAQVASGTVAINYGGDGQGGGGINMTYTGPALTHMGQAVTLSSSGPGQFTGKVGNLTIFTMVFNAQTGGYTFTQFEQLDHPNPNNPNEPLNLTFGLTITDADGDTDVGTITAVVLDDAPIAISDSFSSNGASVSGNIVTNDNFSEDTFNVGAGNHVFDVFFGGQTIAVPQNGTSVTVTNAAGTLTIDMNGVFTYTPPLPGQGTVFRYRLIDFDGDLSAADAANGTTVTVDTDATPIIGNSTIITDETSLISGPAVTNGSVSSEFFGDGPGSIILLNSFSSGGSKLGGNLTSNGVTVNVALAGNTYTGTANGVTVFTLLVNTDGTYTFTQFEQLDHANGSDPNDIITLNFAVRGTDADGDQDDGTITVNIRDDAPAAQDDNVNFAPNQNTASGNVRANDLLGQDSPVPVISVTFNGNTVQVPQNGTNISIIGAHGTLTINNLGDYTYTSSNTTTGTDTFTYTIRDYDGDPSSANLNVTITDIDTVPVIDNSSVTVDETNLAGGPNVVSGTVGSNYFADGPGSIAPLNQFTPGGSLQGGNLTSHGVAVNVTLVGNTYTGTAGGITVFTLLVNANGSYTFTQYEQLDHADANNPNDVITLNFTVRGTDSDGDTDTGVITVNVLDDAPVAVNDSFLSNTSTATGNIMSNDNPGQDVPARVYDVTFGGQTVVLNANGTNSTITNAAGTLTINSTGQFTYTPPLPGQGTTFTYRLIDFDNDLSVANAQNGTVVVDTDGTPTITTTTVTVDEDGPRSTNGTAVGNFFGDGPGTFLICQGNTMSASGSLLNGQLTSGGVAVTTSLSGNTYTGTANGQTVFTLVLAASGAYTFTLFKPLDHANPANPNDIINLNFQICATDADGDVGHGTIVVNVVDSAPIAANDAITYCTNDYFISGNLMSGLNPGGGTINPDYSSFDTPTKVYAVSSAAGGTQTTTGDVSVIDGLYGKLYVFANGAYVYYANGGEHTESFTYWLKDFDGDTSAATFTVTSQNTHAGNASIIVVNGATNGNDGANALVSYAAGVNDTVFAGGGDDVIMSWSGNDQIHGGAGNDTLIGEYGSDMLWGDSGADVFVSSRTDFNGDYLGRLYDTIMDFNAGEGDVIDLTALIDNGSAAQGAINSYVRSINSGGGSMLQVNDAGVWRDAVYVNGQQNLDVQALLNSGNLDVN